MLLIYSLRIGYGHFDPKASNHSLYLINEYDYVLKVLPF